MLKIRSQEKPSLPSRGSLLSDPSSSWRTALPAELPPYALTRVQLGNDHPDGDWCEVPPELVASALSFQSQMISVQSRGLGNFHDFDDHPASISDDRVRLFRNTDLAVEEPPLSLEQAEPNSLTLESSRFRPPMRHLNQIDLIRVQIALWVLVELLRESKAPVRDLFQKEKQGVATCRRFRSAPLGDPQPGSCPARGFRGDRRQLALLNDDPLD